jgi:hypothetical protein
MDCESIEEPGGTRPQMRVVARARKVRSVERTDPPTVTGTHVGRRRACALKVLRLRLHRKPAPVSGPIARGKEDARSRRGPDKGGARVESRRNHYGDAARLRVLHSTREVPTEQRRDDVVADIARILRVQCPDGPLCPQPQVVARPGQVERHRPGSRSEVTRQPRPGRVTEEDRGRGRDHRRSAREVFQVVRWDDARAPPVEVVERR